jgi:hypothetical protein
MASWSLRIGQTTRHFDAARRFRSLERNGCAGPIQARIFEREKLQQRWYERYGVVR